LTLFVIPVHRARPPPLDEDVDKLNVHDAHILSPEGGGMILMKRCLLSLDDGSDEEGTAMLVLSLKLERNHLLFSSVCYLV
jgi:hypothetical protein